MGEHGNEQQNEQGHQLGDERVDPGGEVRWLDEQQQRDWRATILGMTMLLTQLSRDLEATTGLSMPEYELLVRLSESPDRTARMSDLADQVVHSRSRVTHTVTRLEKAGLVERRRADADGRGIVAALTDAGFASLEAAAPHHVRSVRSRSVDVRGTEELHGLGGAMRKILRADGIDEAVLHPGL